MALLFFCPNLIKLIAALPLRFVIDSCNLNDYLVIILVFIFKHSFFFLLANISPLMHFLCLAKLSFMLFSTPYIRILFYKKG